jgi:YHS domain-containing protein
MKVIDPVCKMEVDTGKALNKEYKDKTYYFCSKGCLDAFSKGPAKYIKTEASNNHSHGLC